MSTSKVKTWKRISTIVVSLLTLGLHFYLTQHFFELQLGLSSGEALCNVNKVFNCDVVSASKFASIFGAPTSLWGVASQLVLLFFLVVTLFGLSKNKALTARWSYFLSITIAGASIIMAGISVTSLSAYCLFCLLAYGLSFLHVWLIKGLTHSEGPSSPFTDIKTALTSERWLALTTLSIIPIVFIFNTKFMGNFGGATLKQAVDASTSHWSSGETYTFNSNGLSKGPEQAKMTIVEFADFLCPHCKHAVPTLKVFTETHPEVRLIFKSFALDGNCNGTNEMPKGDGTRCLIAKTVHCGEKLGQKGWFFYEQAFKHQEEFMGLEPSKAVLAGLTKEAGIEASAMETCVASEETHRAILDQAQDGINAKIEGTPALFVNGRYLPRGQILIVLQKIFELISQ